MLLLLLLSSPLKQALHKNNKKFYCGASEFTNGEALL